MRFLPIALAVTLVAGCAGPEDPAEKAREALERGDPQETFRLLAPRAARSADGQAHLDLAVACLRTMRLSAGIAAAGRAIELRPGLARAHGVKADLGRRRSLVLAARESAAEAVRLAPDDADLRTAQGFACLAQGRQGAPDYSGAEAAFREALRLVPGDPRARFGLGKALVLSDRHAEGRVLLDSLIAGGAEFGELLSLRGIARLRDRDFAGAVEDMQRALAFGATDPSVHFSLSRALLRLDRRAEAEEQRRLHDAAREREKYVEGLFIAYSLASDDVALATELGRVLTELRRFEDAVPILQSLCNDRPKLPRPHLFLAKAAFGAELFDLAASAIDTALALAPESVEANHLAAHVAIARGEGRAAERHAAAGARLGPTPELSATEQLYTLAEAHLAAGEPEAADEALRQLRARGGASPRLEALRARVLLALGLPEEAERVMTGALRSRRFRYRWFDVRGKARLEQGNAGRAADDFRTAVELAPSWPPAHEDLARALDEMGDRDGAGAERQAHGEATDRQERIRRLRARVYADPSRFDIAMELAALLVDAGLPAEAGRVRARAFESWGPRS